MNTDEEYKLNYRTEVFENPMSEIPLEERVKMIRKMGKDAAAKFTQKMKDFEKWFSQERDFDQTYLLSYCLRYFMMYEKGYDEEAVTGKLSFPPHYLEILQTLALTGEQNISARPLMGKGEDFLREMQHVGELMQLKLFALPDPDMTIDELNTYKVRIDMMSYHMSVRNWAYYFQMKRVAKDMATAVSADFIRVHGADPTVFVEVIFAMCEQVNKRMNSHLKRLRSALIQQDPMKMQEAYAKAFSGVKIESKKGKKKMWEMAGKDLVNLRIMLMAHSDLRLADIMTFTIDDLEQLSGHKLTRAQVIYLFDLISFSFGDLKDIDRERIILDNPSHDNPFIKLSQNSYYSSLWTTIPHLSISMLEGLVAADDKLRKRYNDFRSAYLEEKLYELCKASFPSGMVFKGSQWLHDGPEHKRYENDVLVVVDSFALVFEAKSGTLTKAAKRGAPDRLFKTMKELIEAPSEQALRFIEYLKTHKGKLKLPTKSGKPNEIDVSGVNYFIPIGVTFYDLGMAGTNLKQIIEAKATSLKIEELAPSISLTDLQVIFELLDSEAMRVHYLHRRREIEAGLKYFASELDLVAFYLDNGFNIGDYELEKDMVFQLSVKSKDLDPYFNSKDEGGGVEKPGLKQTKWWNDILARLAQIKTPRWLEFSYVLLNFNKGDQINFAKGFTELKAKVKAGDVQQEFNWVEFVTANPNRHFVVAGYAYRQSHHDKRHDDIRYVMGHILDANPKLKGLVILSVNVDNEHYPYNSMAGELSVTLVDDLFVNISMIAKVPEHENTPIENLGVIRKRLDTD